MPAAAVTASSNALFVYWDRFVLLGDQWYKQDKEWKERKRLMERYREEMETWKKAASDRGLSSHETLTRRLDAARASLEKEEQKLRKKEASWIQIVGRHVSRTVFPSQVESSLQQVDLSFENIRKAFETKQDVGEVLDKELNSGVYADSFSPDSRYVRFEVTEANIREALNTDNGPSVVLLHGGAGKGKSTVAGSTAAYYDPERNLRFVCVVFHAMNSAGPIHFTKLLHQLIQRLGHRPLADPEEQETSRSIPLERQLKKLLEERKMLLVLDDLSDNEEDFLLRMVRIRVSGLKMLITAQVDTVCRNLDPNSDFVKIQIQGVDKNTARKILAVHSGFSNHELPPHLLEVADDLIAQTDHNPLAIATLGGAIDKSLRETEEEWVNLSRNLSRALKFDKGPGGLFFTTYPRSLWSTLELVITTKLSVGARKLLLLAHAFSSTSVPEEIVELLYEKVQEDEGTFSIFRKELYDRQLITINVGQVDAPGMWEFGMQRIKSKSSLAFAQGIAGFLRQYWDSIAYRVQDLEVLEFVHMERRETWKPSRAWNVHYLQKLYIEIAEGMRYARDSVLDSFMGAQATSKDRLVLTLATVYLKKDLANKAAAKRSDRLHLAFEQTSGFIMVIPSVLTKYAIVQLFPSYLMYCIDGLVAAVFVVYVVARYAANFSSPLRQILFEDKIIRILLVPILTFLFQYPDEFPMHLIIIPGSLVLIETIIDTYFVYSYKLITSLRFLFPDPDKFPYYVIVIPGTLAFGAAIVSMCILLRYIEKCSPGLVWGNNGPLPYMLTVATIEFVSILSHLTPNLFKPRNWARICVFATFLSSLSIPLGL